MVIFMWLVVWCTTLLPTVSRGLHQILSSFPRYSEFDAIVAISFNLSHHSVCLMKFRSAPRHLSPSGSRISMRVYYYDFFHRTTDSNSLRTAFTITTRRCVHRYVPVQAVCAERGAVGQRTVPRVDGVS